MTLSVILPVYNVETFLGECLDSVLAQTFRDFELIAIDDGSSDGSAAILERYARADKRIRVVRQPNAGLGAARNRGLEISSGKYVHFVDSDDILEPTTYERVIGEMESHDLDQLVFSAKAFGEKGASEATQKRIDDYNRYYAIASSIEGRVVEGGEMMALMLETGHLFVSVPLRVMRRDTLLKGGCRFVEGVVREDESFTNLMMLKSPRVMALKDRFYLRRVREGSLASGGAAARHVEGLLFAAVKLAEAERTIGMSERVRHVADFISRNYRRAIGELKLKHPEAIAEALKLMSAHGASESDVAIAEAWISSRERMAPKCLTWRIFRKLKRIVQEVFGK